MHYALCTMHFLTPYSLLPKMSIELTSVAAAEVLNVMENQELDADKTYLRVVIRSGGCSGMNYGLAFDEKYDKTVDAIYPQNGVNVVTAKKFAQFLDGSSINFLDNAMGRGFLVENPTFPANAGCADCHH